MGAERQCRARRAELRQNQPFVRNEPVQVRFFMRRINSSVPNFPLPAAHHTLTPFVSRMRSQQSMPTRFFRSVSNVSL